LREEPLTGQGALGLLAGVCFALACSACGVQADTSSDAGGAAGAGAARAIGAAAGVAGADADTGVGIVAVDTTCGLAIDDACPSDPASDGQCGLEEAVLAVRDQRSEYGCAWPSHAARGVAISVPNHGLFKVSGTLRVESAVVIRSAVPGTLATIQGTEEHDLFGVEPVLPVSVSFEDLHLIGAGHGLQTQATGIAISGETPDRGATVNVTRCWIEQFSNGAIVATDVNLNVSDSTLADNNNDFGDGGGGIFYDTNGDAASQVDFLTVSSSSIVRNHSTKGAGIHIQSSSITRITNSTIADNLTDGGHGGGISFANNAGPLADGVLRIVGSTIAFNGSTTFSGAGIAVGANRELFEDNVNNQIYLSGSIVANNCMAQPSAEGTFSCLSPSDYWGELFGLQDSVLGSTDSTVIFGPDRGGLGLSGIALRDVDAGLDPELTDQGGVGAHHAPVHSLQPESVAIDAAAVLATPNLFDQTHRLRGVARFAEHVRGFDLGAVEAQ
jgi:hypothetical protein